MDNPTGKISLVFRKKTNGDTYLAKQYFKLPLQIMTPYYYDGDGTVFLYLLNPSGGILQHDRLFTEVLVEQGGKVLLTTPSNTKFYKMDEGYAHLVNTVTMENDAVLEYLPEHNVPFAASDTLQETSFYLKESSVLIASDILTSGRVSRGEIFQYTRYRARTKIYVDGKLIALDGCDIRPDRDRLDQIGMLEDHLSNGTLYIYKKGMDDKLLEDINQMGKATANVRFGASQVDDSLLLVRFTGSSILDMQDTMLAVWDVSRRSLLGKPAARIRKY